VHGEPKKEECKQDRRQARTSKLLLLDSSQLNGEVVVSKNLGISGEKSNKHFSAASLLPSEK